MVSTLPIDVTGDVVVQMHNSDNSNCWGASFAPATVIKNSDTGAKAKTP